MKLQQLLSYTRRAIDDYGMIEEGDRIAVGISGGKDSLTMLYAMANLRRFYPKSFEIEAISIDLGFGDMDFSKVEALCKELDVNFTVVPTQIFPIVFNERKESNPCSLCAKMRKGAFNDICKQLNCNKVAYAHHKDDLIETLLMSLLFEGRLGSFSPITYLDRTELTVIRPLMYVNEKDVIGFKNAYNLPVIKSPCPADGYTKRQYAKDLVKQLNHENPGVKERMFHAIVTGNFEDWPKLVR
ncbi:MAG: ATP-binding protein [bacterium]|nr:ATP-binding protein [bacterium]